MVLAGDLGAGKTAFTQGFGRALDVTEPITSPTFTLAQQYEGRMVVHHLDVYRLDQLAEVAELGLSELLDDGGVVLIEWGDAILPVLPNDYLEVRLTFGDRPASRRRRPADGAARRRGRLGGRQVSLLHAIAPWAEAAPKARAGDRAVLILGITTSTMQVGCAIGGHEGVLAQVHSSRGKRHAETLTPSIDFLRHQARVDLDEIGCVAVDLGPGCSPACGSGWRRPRRSPTPCGCR